MATCEGLAVTQWPIVVNSLIIKNSVKKSKNCPEQKKDSDEGECQKLAAATSSVKSVAMKKKY